MKIKIAIILLGIILTSCGGEPYYKKREKRLNLAKEEYSRLTSEQRQLAEDIFNNDYNSDIQNVPRKNNILVIHKRNGEVLPDIETNDDLKEGGYNVTYNPSELEYFIAIKTKGTESGKYTDGSAALDTETNIYVIDVKNGNKYKIYNEFLKAPEKIQKSRSDKETHRYGERGIEGSSLVKLIIDKVIE